MVNILLYFVLSQECDTCKNQLVPIRNLFLM